MQSMQILPIFIVIILHGTHSVRLHKLFQFIDGFKSEHNLHGFLHVGNDYAVFIRAPKSHDKFVTYELYEAKNVPDIETYKPQMLAVSKVPIDYLKDQLKTFRNELYKAKYVDDNIIPGTQVKTMREWQIAKVLNFHGNAQQMYDKVPILRTVL